MNRQPYSMHPSHKCPPAFLVFVCLFGGSISIGAIVTAGDPPPLASPRLQRLELTGFSSWADAERAASHLRELNLEARIRETAAGFVVDAGAFSTEDGFKRAQDRLTRAGFANRPHVVDVSTSPGSGDASGTATGSPQAATQMERIEATVAGLRATLAEQSEKLDAQQRMLSEQAKVIASQKQLTGKHSREVTSLRDRVLSQEWMEEQRGVGAPVQAGGQQAAPTKPVGQRAPRAEGQRPQVATIPEIGGVLTRQGQLLLEPGFFYTQSNTTQFTFLGVQILPAFLIGLLEVETADRDLYSPQLTARYGITNDWEAEVKVPYVIRDDREEILTPPPLDSPDPITITRDLDADGIGDIEAALHYQTNRILEGWPVFVGNVRYKSDTGEGPFDVDFSGVGLATELPTGSGFHAVEPSVTVLYPSDPAVFFGNVGYAINLEKDVDRVIGNEASLIPPGLEPRRIGTVDPGDVLRVSFGMGYSLNERSSFTLGYKHDFIDETKTEIDNTVFDSRSLDVGALLIGWAYGWTDRVTSNLNLELGITEDAPDVQISLRVPLVAYRP